MSINIKQMGSARGHWICCLL